MDVKLDRKRALATVALLTSGGLVLSACSDASEDRADGDDQQPVSSYELADVTGTVAGAGATSQQLAMENIFLPAFEAHHSSVEFAPTGSNAGVEEFLAGDVDFAATDTPLTDEQRKQAQQRCESNSAIHLPMVAGPIAVAYHLDGVDEELTLPVPVIAEIFNGDIEMWNDPRIAEANEGIELPELEIEVVYRADQSGTTEHFQQFLGDATGDLWESEGKVFPTPVGVGANGTAGVADEAAKTNGAITYVESGALDDQQTLRAAAIDFGAGPVSLSTEAVNNALNGAAMLGEAEDLVLDSAALYRAKNPDSYPLVMASYEVVCSAGYDEQTSDLVKNFLYTMLDNQGSNLERAGYVPLDGELKEQLEAAVDSIA